jgi:DNA replication and repair protein RecF
LPLSHLRISAVRCLTEVEVDLDQRRNYVFGPNGAGKTSILESIYLLGRGRSFRTRQIRKLVRTGTDGFSVFGEVRTTERSRRVGVAFDDGHLQKKLDGDETVGTAELAVVLPVHVIEPGIHALIEGAPSERRRFLDWGVFHVEHAYLDGWRQYRRILGQRNAALKGASSAELQGWTTALVEAGQYVHDARRVYVEKLAGSVAEIGARLFGTAVHVGYRQGWSDRLGFEEALAEAEAADRAQGVTHVGPHRADLEVLLDERGVRDEASRGQQKLVATTLVLGQVCVHRETTCTPGVLLVDDPGAELDTSALTRLLDTLDALPAQLIITGLSAAQLSPLPGFPVFHVERGKVHLV